MTESVLARLHFVVRVDPTLSAKERKPIDAARVEALLVEATRTWRDDLADAVGPTGHLTLPGPDESFELTEAHRGLLEALEGETRRTARFVAQWRERAPEMDVASATRGGVETILARPLGRVRLREETSRLPEVPQ